MFKKLHPVYKALRLVSGYCAKRRVCEGCLFSDETLEGCILQNRDHIPADWAVPRKEDKHDKG